MIIELISGEKDYPIDDDIPDFGMVRARYKLDREMRKAHYEPDSN